MWKSMKSCSRLKTRDSKPSTRSHTAAFGNSKDDRRLAKGKGSGQSIEALAPHLSIRANLSSMETHLYITMN
jgi:hypothetical protein